MSEPQYRRNYDPAGRRGALVVLGAVIVVMIAAATAPIESTAAVRDSGEHTSTVGEGGGEEAVKETVEDERPTNGSRGSEAPVEESTDFTEADREQVELTVSEFVSSAYGYSGEDPAAYSQAIDSVVMPDFYSSTGGEWIGRYTEAVGDRGIYSAATLDRLETDGAGSDRVTATAYFQSGAVGEEPTD